MTRLTIQMDQFEPKEAKLKSWAVQNKALLHQNVDKLEKHAKPCIFPEK